MEIKRKNYTVRLGEPILYVDNKSQGRSGHMTHAMAEFAPGKIIDFNSNCSAAIYGGHSTFGWVEYRISEDSGETYSEVMELPYSKQAFFDGSHVISVEKAVACEDGRIVAICLRNDAHALCQPWDTPMTVTSLDGGKSWGEPKELCSYKGRVYDACPHGGIIYVLEFCNDGTGCFCGESEEHVYRIFTSCDKGESFEELCVVPIPSMGRGYGAMLFDDAGNLHIYAYNLNDAVHMDHIVSRDGGKTWEQPSACYLKEGIRNPQVAEMDGVYILHGRNAGASGFVLYTSEDGENWDEGTYIGKESGGCYYSNNIVLKDKNDKNRLLIQYSEMYGRESCVNIFHRYLTIEKTPKWHFMKEIKRNGYTVHLSEPILYVDNEKRNRSGHMSHAMAEFAPGKIIDFNSNCSAAIYLGHSTFGFLEYRISEDGGKSFSEPKPFPYSLEQLYDGIHTVSLEKAIALANGKIITFCLLNDAHTQCEPWDTPRIVTSLDGGKSWGEPKELCSYKGRVYDAILHNGIIYVIQFCNDATVSFLGNKPEHIYRLYASKNGGESFEELCVIPAETTGRSYASIVFDGEERMHLYTYDRNAEHDPDHLVSTDYGRTFESLGKCHLAKGSRNIQTAYMNGVFVLHCRGEEINRNKFALYTSKNGHDWDEGEFIDKTDFDTCFYSNNLLLKDENGAERLLIQYSHSYLDKCVNVRHLWLTIEKD